VDAGHDDRRETPRDGDESRTLAAVRSLERGIAVLTNALAAADDDEVIELMRERRAMRDELRAIHEASAGNVVRITRGAS